MDEANHFDAQELGRRRQMAIARHGRDGRRLAFLTQLLDAQRRSDELKNWINACAHLARDNSHPELQRMVSWAEAQLNDLNCLLSPDRISAALRERDLFPEIDSLNDPLGDPPGNRMWGLSPLW